MDWNAILIAVFSNALLLGFIAFLGKAMFSHFLEKDISKFKQELEHKALLEIERFKSDLEIDRIRLQISYGGIFEKQANVILELHTAIIELQTVASDCMDMPPEDPNARKQFRKAWEVIRSEYRKKRALLPQEIDDGIKLLLENVLKSTNEYFQVERRLLRNPTDDEFEKLCEKQDKAIEVINEEVPRLEQSLVQSMRKILGISHY